MDFLKKIQTHWVLLVFLLAFLAKTFNIYDNIINIWNTPEEIQNIKNTASMIDKKLCKSIKLHKNIIISNSNLFNALLMMQSDGDVKTIEIVKEMAKTHIKSQSEILQELIQQCND